MATFLEILGFVFHYRLSLRFYFLPVHVKAIHSEGGSDVKQG